MQLSPHLVLAHLWHGCCRPKKGPSCSPTTPGGYALELQTTPLCSNCPLSKPASIAVGRSFVCLWSHHLWLRCTKVQRWLAHVPELFACQILPVPGERTHCLKHAPFNSDNPSGWPSQRLRRWGSRSSRLADKSKRAAGAKKAPPAAPPPPGGSCLCFDCLAVSVCAPEVTVSSGSTAINTQLQRLHQPLSLPCRARPLLRAQLTWRDQPNSWAPQHDYYPNA